jgi:hypothetical protein
MGTHRTCKAATGTRFVKRVPELDTGGVDTYELKCVIGCSTGHFVLLNISVNPTSN